MSRSTLRLARRPLAQAPAAAVLGTLLAAAGIAGLVAGGPQGEADALLEGAWEAVRAQPPEGPILDATRARAVDLRARVGAWPTEAKRRVAYAAVLYAAAREDADRDAAAFHAAAAARLAPSTAPVQASAAVLLAGSGRIEEGLGCVRRLFTFEPRMAARTLLQLEPLLDEQELAAGLPSSPAAFLAWAAQLRGEGEGEEADLWLDRAWARWPEHPGVLRAAATRDRDRRLWPEAAARLRGRALPADLRALRARALAETGARAEALADLEAAVREGEGSPDVLQPCAEAALAAGEIARSRALFEETLHRLPPSASPARRVAVLRRLAAVEERLGHAGAALRLWREVLALSGDDAAARGRVAALGGR